MSDLRDAFRSLTSTPIVSIVAVLSLALGIGANTAIFSILDSLLLRALPVKAPQQLVIVGDETGRRTYWTNPIWEQIRERQGLFDGGFASSSTRFNLARGGQTELVDGPRRKTRLPMVTGTSNSLGSGPTSYFHATSPVLGSRATTKPRPVQPVLNGLAATACS